MWYRCQDHGSYNVSDNLPHFLVQCPECKREEAERFRRRQEAFATGRLHVKRGQRRKMDLREAAAIKLYK